jgi:hypothetical protein
VQQHPRVNLQIKIPFFHVSTINYHTIAICCPFLIIRNNIIIPDFVPNHGPQKEIFHLKNWLDFIHYILKYTSLELIIQILVKPKSDISLKTAQGSHPDSFFLLHKRFFFSPTIIQTDNNPINSCVWQGGKMRYARSTDPFGNWWGGETQLYHQSLLQLKTERTTL